MSWLEVWFCDSDFKRKQEDKEEKEKDKEEDKEDKKVYLDKSGWAPRWRGRRCSGTTATLASRSYQGTPR